MTKLPLVFSGLAVLFGLLVFFKFKGNRLLSLLFYASLFASGLSRALICLLEGQSVRFVDIGVMIVFGVAAIGELLLLLRERREQVEQS